MTVTEWQASADPMAMIDWLEEQGYDEQLWDFTIACCRRVWDELPGEAFRRVIEYVERIGMRGIDEILSEASQALDSLERDFRKAAFDTDQARLNRQIGFGRMIFAFEYQDGAGAAGSISGDLVAWADDSGVERRTQAELLRQLVPEPSQPAEADDGE